MFYLKAKKVLKDKKVIITAGGTIQPIDPVRFIGNFSSGKMGIAIAREFRKYTKNVILIYGNISIKLPARVHCIKAITVEDMYSAIKNYFSDTTVLVMAAAVSDFKVAKFFKSKIKKQKKITLTLVPTIDILKQLSKHKKRSNYFVGFAAESKDVIKNARQKLNEKNLDMIVANPVTKRNYPFGSDFNQVYFITNLKIEKLPVMKKNRIAKLLVRRIVDEIRRV